MSNNLSKMYDYVRIKAKDPAGNRAFFKAYMKKYMMSMSRSNGGNVHRNKWFCVTQYVLESMDPSERTPFILYLHGVVDEVGKNFKAGMLRTHFTLEVLKLGINAGPTSNDPETGQRCIKYQTLANTWHSQFSNLQSPEHSPTQHAWFMNWCETYSLILANCGHYELADQRTIVEGNEERVDYHEHVCLACARSLERNGLRVMGRMGRLILSEFAVTVHTRHNAQYLDDRRRAGYTFNQARQIWTDSMWTPYGDLLGGYHSSRNRGFEIIDSPWFRQNRRAFGIELEVQIRNGSLDKKLAAIHEAVNYETQQLGEYCFFERDGSIGEGFEMVSQPAGLDVHRDRLGRFLNNSQLKMGFRSHEGGACGLHVHVGREFLTQGQIYRVQSFLNDVRNEALIRAIARRYDNNYCRFKPQLAKFTIHGKHSTERYEALNVTNPDTIEFRIFRGSLRYESVMAALEFVNSLLTFCTPGEVSLTQFTAIGFKQWLMQPERKAENRFLRSYLSLDGNNDNEQTTTAAAA